MINLQKFIYECYYQIICFDFQFNAYVLISFLWDSMFYYWLSNSSQDPDAGDIKTEALGGNSCAGSKPVTDSASYEITMKNCTLQENEDCTLFSSLESSDLINVKLSGAPNFHYEINPIPPPIQSKLFYWLWLEFFNHKYRFHLVMFMTLVFP